ncbi:hypothetical protein RS030_111877 [Cryptosporidium xiaoi]|uniref:Chorein N-terminal domain-containing protein n=1 Tax=Cryptosporidium xiaoi TaxID=659607 RepID=A0AAV9Y3P3_9CRYT
MVLGSSIIKSLIGNLLEKLGSDIFGNWNLAENIEINSFSPLEIELRNIPIPQLLFEIADLPFIIIYSNIRRVKVCLKTDKMPSEDNPLNIEAWDVDIQFRMATLDEWDSKKWCKRFHNTKIRKLRKWYNYISPWSSKKVDNIISQSIEVSLVNSLNININNIHAFFLDDTFGPKPFCIEILCDSMNISSPNDGNILSEEELKGKKQNLLEFMWIRFYSLRIIYRIFDQLLLKSVPKNVITKILDIGSDSKQNSEEMSDELRHDENISSKNDNGFISKTLKNILPFIFSSENTETQKLSFLNNFLCNLNNDDASRMEYVKELTEFSNTSKEFDYKDYPKHTQNGNSKFIKLPEGLSNTIQLTTDNGLELHILFKRWDIRSLNAPHELFDGIFRDSEDYVDYISSREWKCSKLIILPSTDKFTNIIPSEDDIKHLEPLSVICTTDFIASFYNFINYFNQWSTFLKSCQYIYNNRKTINKMEEYLKIVILSNQGNSSHIGLSKIPKQVLTDLETYVSIRDIVSIHMSANEFLNDYSSVSKGFFNIFNKANDINSNAVHEFILKKVIKKMNSCCDDLITDKSNIEFDSFSTFKKWFSSENKLQISLPSVKLSLVLSDLSSIFDNIDIVPEWMKYIIINNIKCNNIEDIIGKISSLTLSFGINFITDKELFYNRSTYLYFSHFEICKSEVSLINSFVRRNKSFYFEKQLQRIPYSSVYFIPLNFLPCFKIIEIDNKNDYLVVNNSIDIFNGGNTNKKEDDSKLKLIDIDNNKVKINRFNHTKLNIDEYFKKIKGFKVEIKQLFASISFDYNGFNPNFTSFKIDIDDCKNINSMNNCYNYLSLNISEISIYDLKSIWIIGSLIPNVTTNIGSILFRSNNDIEKKIVKSLFTMINSVTKINSTMSFEFENIKIKSKYPINLNSPSHYTTEHLCVRHFHGQSDVNSCLCCYLESDRISDVEMSKNTKFIVNGENNSELSLYTFKVGHRNTDYYKHDKCSSTNSLNLIKDKFIGLKINRIVTDIISSPNDLINSLKTFRVMESSQSIFKGFTGFMNSSIGNILSFDCDDDEINQMTESLLYNDILIYLLQNEYFLEENTTYNGVEILINNVLINVTVQKSGYSFDMKNDSIKILTTNTNLNGEVINNNNNANGCTNLSDHNNLNVKVISLCDLKIKYSTKDFYILIKKLNINMFPGILYLLNGYELLIFPNKFKFNLKQILANFSSIRKNRIEDDIIDNSELIESEVNSNHFLKLFKFAKFILEESNVNIYDSELLLYTINMYYFTFSYNFIEENKEKVSIVIALNELHIEHITNVKLQENINEYQQIKKEYLEKTFYIPSVIFSKYSGHLVPNEKISDGNINTSTYPFILTYSDEFKYVKKSQSVNMIDNEPQFSFELKMIINDKQLLDSSADSSHEEKNDNFYINQHLIIFNAKVNNGNFFFSKEQIIKFKSIIDLYFELFKKYSREKNTLFGINNEYESLINQFKLILKTNNKNNFDINKGEKSHCIECGGYNKNNMVELKVKDKFYGEFSLLFENFYVHFIVNSDNLYKNKLIDNKLMNIHKDTIEFSNESFTIIRPLYCYNYNVFDRSNINIRTAILTGESIGSRLNFRIKSSLSTTSKTDDFGNEESSNNIITLNNREWKIKVGFKEINIMLLRNGTWGMLDFSIRKITLKLLVVVENVYEYINSEMNLSVLEKFNNCITKLLSKDGKKSLKVKFKVSDICVWSILYERIREYENNFNKTRVINVDMYFTKKTSGLEYVYKSPYKNIISEYSTSYLPEFMTIDRNYLIIDEKVIKKNNQELFPSWEYGLNLPLPIPFNNKYLLSGCKPKIFPVFGKRPIKNEEQEIMKINLKKENYEIKDIGDVYIMPIMSLISNEIFYENGLFSQMIINIVISPTFISMVPFTIRQLLDLFYMFNRFSTLDLDSSLFRKRKDENINFSNIKSNNNNNNNNNNGNNNNNNNNNNGNNNNGNNNNNNGNNNNNNNDSIIKIIELFNRAMITSFEVKVKFNTLIITFPELNDLIKSESISSCYFESVTNKKNSIFDISDVKMNDKLIELIKKRNKYILDTDHKLNSGINDNYDGDYYLFSFTNKNNPALAISHNFRFHISVENNLKFNNGNINNGIIFDMNNNVYTESIKLNFEISQLRIQLPFLKNIGADYSIDSLIHNNTINKKNNIKLENDLENMSPILDVFIPSINSSFILTKTMTKLNISNKYKNNTVIKGIMFGMINIPLVFAIDGAKIPVIDDTYILREYTLKLNNDSEEKNINYFNNFDNNKINDILVDEEDTCLSNYVINKSELLSIIVNMIGNNYLRLQMCLNNFRFIFSLTTFSVSSPYIERMYSWWNDIWLINMRYPRNNNSTMRYFILDTKNDMISISSFGIVSKSNIYKEDINDDYSDINIYNENKTNEIYSVNRFNYLDQEITGPIYYPLDETIPIVIAYPMTALLNQKLKPFNSIEYKDDNLKMLFDNTLIERNNKILHNLEHNYVMNNTSVNNDKTSNLTVNVQLNTKKEPNPYKICGCKTSSINNSNSEYKLKNDELDEFNSDEYYPIKNVEKLSLNIDDSINNNLLNISSKIVSDDNVYESNKNSKKSIVNIFNIWGSKKSKATYNNLIEESEHFSSLKRKSFSIFKKRNSKECVPYILSPISENKGHIMKRGFESLTLDYNNLDSNINNSYRHFHTEDNIDENISRCGDYNFNEESDLCSYNNEKEIEFQISLSNLEIWFHRDISKYNNISIFNSNSSNEEATNLTLEEVSLDWMSKAVHCIPSSVDNDTYKIQINNNNNNNSSFINIRNDELYDNVDFYENYNDDEYEDNTEYDEYENISIDYDNYCGKNVCDRTNSMNNENMFYDANENFDEYEGYNDSDYNYNIQISNKKLNLFTNSYEIYKFRKNISTYDQADYDYIMKSSRYGKRQGLSVNRYLKSSTPSYYISKNDRNISLINLDDSTNTNDSNNYYKIKDEVNTNKLNINNKSNNSKIDEGDFTDSVAFSMFLNLNLNTLIKTETFNFSCEFNDLMILPGLPVKINYNKFISENFNYKKNTITNKKECNCNYCKIISLRIYMYLLTLNSRNVYIPFDISGEEIKRDLLLYIKNIKLLVLPSSKTVSKLSNKLTTYELNVEFLIDNIILSLSMDIFQEIRLFNEYYRDTLNSIINYYLWYIKSCKTYIITESILNPYSINNYENQINKTIEDPTLNRYRNINSFLNQLLPTNIKTNQLNSEKTSFENMLDIDENISFNSDINTNKELTYQKLSSESLEFVQENQIVLLYTSGFPLSYKNNLNCLPEVIKRHLLHENMGNLDKDRRYGIPALKLDNSNIGKDILNISMDLYSNDGDQNINSHNNYKAINHNNDKNSSESNNSINSNNNNINNNININNNNNNNNNNINMKISNKNKPIFSDNTIYSIIENLFNFTSVPLEWINNGLDEENKLKNEDILKNYSILSQFMLPLSHLNKTRQIKIEYRLNTFNIIIHNNNLDILKIIIEKTDCMLEFPSIINCKLTGTIGAITHDPIMDCMVTVVKPFPYDIIINSTKNNNFNNNNRNYNQDYNYSTHNILMNNLINNYPILNVNFCTESISLEITSGFLQNIRLILSDYSNLHLLGLSYAYGRKINTVKIINDLGQSSLIVQPILMEGVYVQKDIVGIRDLCINEKKNENGIVQNVNNDVKGLKKHLLKSGEYCNISINLPVYMAIQKFTHRKGQKIAARIQANRNSDFWKNNYKNSLIDESEIHFNEFLNITSKMLTDDVNVKDSILGLNNNNNNNSNYHVINMNIKDNDSNNNNNNNNNDNSNDNINNNNNSKLIKENRKKNNSNLILSDISNELCSLGISKRKKHNIKHLWLEDKKSSLLFGSTGIAEYELKQLAEQLELSTPVLRMNTEGVDMMLHRFLISQSTWSSIGKLKDDTLYRRAYRLGTLGFLVVLEPESGIYSNEWIWTLGTCIQIENSTNILFRVTANWRQGIRYLCGSIFVESSKNAGNDLIRNDGNKMGDHFPYIDIPPYSRRSIPVSWFLLSDMEPNILPLLVSNDLYNDDNYEDDYGDENTNQNNYKNRNLKTQNKSVVYKGKVRIDKKSLNRIQSKMSPIPFTILKSLVNEIMSTQPGNISKAKIVNEITTLTFESLMGFNCQVESMDIPTSDKYVTSYSYTIKITPLIKITNSLPFPIHIRLKIPSGIKIPNLKNIDFSNNYINDFQVNDIKLLELIEEYSPKYIKYNENINNKNICNDHNHHTEINKIKINKNSNYFKLKNVYKQEFVALIDILNGKYVDYIIQSQQELELPICRQKLDITIYVNGSPLEYCCYPLFTNTSESTDYIQSRNTMINKYIYKSKRISISFPFGNTLTQNVSLKRIFGNPLNLWNPFYSKLIKDFFGDVDNIGLSKLIDSLNNMTISISISSKRILFSTLSRIENTSDSIICLFINNNIPSNNNNNNNTNSNTVNNVNNNLNSIFNISLNNYIVVPLPPMYRYFTTIENLKNIRLSTLCLDLIDNKLNISKYKNNLSLYSNELNYLISNNIKISHISKISPKYDLSLLGTNNSINLPLKSIQGKEYDQKISIGSTTHNNDLLSQLNCPLVSFYNKYEFISQLPFPIIIHRYVNSNEMHKKINSELSNIIDIEYENKDNSIIYFRNKRKTNESELITDEKCNENEIKNDFRDNNNNNNNNNDNNHHHHNIDYRKKSGNKNNENNIFNNDIIENNCIDFKLPPKTSLSSSDLLLRPNERRPYHDTDLKIWISKPIVEGVNEPFQASREFLLFSGQKVEYTPQLSKFQIALHKHQDNNNNYSSGINTINNYSDISIGGLSNMGKSIGLTKLNSNLNVFESDNNTPMLITIQIIPAILGTTSSGSTNLRNLSYFIIFSLAEAPFFEICNFTNYYIAYDTPETRAHNYYYRSKKAVKDVVTGNVSGSNSLVTNGNSGIGLSERLNSIAGVSGTKQKLTLKSSISNILSDKNKGLSHKKSDNYSDDNILKIDEFKRSKTFNNISYNENSIRDKSSKKLTYINHHHLYGNAYVYPDIFSAKSADIGIIPPNTRIPYIPKSWDCEYIGIRPFNVKKSVWTTHSITSINEQISVITFIKYSSDKKIDKLINNNTSNEININHNKFQNPFTTLNSLSNTNQKIITGKLYVFLMVNSKGTRILTILDNKKHAEKLLNGNITNISNISYNTSDLNSRISNDNEIEINNELDNINIGTNDSTDNLTKTKSIKNELIQLKNNNDSHNHKIASKNENYNINTVYRNNLSNKMKKISWLGFKMSFFIPRISISWIHQNELVLISHGSLFHTYVNIQPQNMYPISILNLACNSLLNICLKLLEFRENKVGLNNKNGVAQNNKLSLLNGLKSFSIINTNDGNSSINNNNKKNIKTLFSHGVTGLFTTNRKKNLNKTEYNDICDFNINIKSQTGGNILKGKKINNKQTNKLLFQNYSNEPESDCMKEDSTINDCNKDIELLSFIIKQIFIFLSKNLSIAGGSVSPKENPVINNVLKMLKKIYKCCLDNEYHIKNRYDNFHYNSSTDIDSLIETEYFIKKLYFQLYNGVMKSILRIVTTLSDLIKFNILMCGKITIKIGLSSIHVDHFLQGDIPVILKTSNIYLSRNEYNAIGNVGNDDSNDIDELIKNNKSSRILCKNKKKQLNKIKNNYNDEDEEDNEEHNDYIENEYDNSKSEREELNNELINEEINRQMDNVENYDRTNNGDFISFTIARSLMNPLYAPIFDEINIQISQISCNLERLVVQTLYFMVSKEIENMNNITYSRQKVLWMHTTRQKMIKKRNRELKKYLGSLVCYVSGGYSLPMYITRTPWDQLKIGKPLYIKTLAISDIIVAISIRTSDDNINIDTLTPEALLFMNILPLDTPHMILNVNSLHKDALVVDIGEFFHFLISSYSRQLKRKVLPSLGVTHLLAVYSGLKRGTKSLFIEIKRGIYDDDLTYIEGFIQGFRVGLIHFFRYLLGGTFQTTSVIFNFGHKLLGGRRPRPKSILDAIWNGIVGLIIDTFITPWILLYKEPIENFRKTNKIYIYILTLIFCILRLPLSPLFGLLNLLASITESFATTLIGDFEQFVHVQSRSELMNDIEKERINNKTELESGNINNNNNN